MFTPPFYTLGETAQEGTDASLYHAFRNADRQPVSIKLLKGESPSPRQLARLRHEYAIMRDLEGTGVLRPYGLERWGSGLALVLEETRAASLESVMKAQKIELVESLRIAIALAEALEAIHRKRIIHKDIHPGAILVDVATHEVKLIDFGSAARFATESQAVRDLDAIEGSLAYISPEQTGRTNRVLDYRTDLYSLGVTLYEMFTGCLPFPTQDPLELVHSHLARRPPRAHEVAPRLPRVISGILDKLLAKSADDRYKHAAGLKSDLEECLRRLDAVDALDGEGSATIDPFPLGQRDAAGTLTLPERLYERDAERSALAAALARARCGEPELVLVSGAAGVGKTALVRGLEAQTSDRQVAFVTGKFEQRGKSAPYAPVAAALRDLVRRLLGERAEVIGALRSRLLAALQPDADLAIQIVPELAWIIGPQPRASALLEREPARESTRSSIAPREATRHLGPVLARLVRALATAERPLVLFFDDLQWADAVSVELIRLLVEGSGRAHLLLLGAYRIGEVAEEHPVARLHADLARGMMTMARVRHVALAPLGAAAVQSLVADALACGDLTRAEPLARIVSDKTRGNPFFIRQFLTGLYREELITWSASRAAFVWDEGRIRAAMISDDVIEIVTRKLARLAPSARILLKLGACIGHQFDVRTLAAIYERPLLETAAGLWEALREGLLLPVDVEHRTADVVRELSVSPEAATLNLVYRFAHDRVQQAAYALSDPEQQREVHLAIGRLLRDARPRPERDDDLFEMVHHLNLGAELMTDPAERQDLARGNLAAGRRARAAGAREVAESYVVTGLALIGEPTSDEAAEVARNLRAELSPTRGLSDAPPAYRSAPPTSAAAIDLVSVLEASRALSGEMELSRLVEKLMTIALESAGAERGALVRGGEGAWKVAAWATVEGHEVRVTQPLEERQGELAPELLPASMLSYVARTRESVVLDEVAADLRFAEDAYVARARPRSVLCVPILRHGELGGVLYLENNLGAAAFTRGRLAVLEILMSQAAIALENATLYARAQAEAEERRRAEEEVRKLNARLEERVSDRTAELRAANTELEAFSYSVSHDLKQPLRIISGFSAALEEEHGAALGEDGRAYIGRIRSASKRMGDLIDDLLRLSRVTRAEVARARIDMSALSRAVFAELERADPERRVELVVPDGLTVLGDTRMMQIALENLIGNAWKFTSKRARARIEIGVVGTSGGEAVFFVKDDGDGFDARKAPRLFGAFQRMHSAADFPGTGIGLATVQRIVRRHGGRIWAESSPGAGATFFFTMQRG
jgi:signal transduction histidine kinase/tRNA A-37 threonylcarbamoyl transferase component Bud32